MSKLKPVIGGALLGAGLMFAALQFHVVRSGDGIRLVPRTPQHSLGLAYADVRDWTPEQWSDRPELARALMAHGESGLIADAAANRLRETVTEGDTLNQLRDALNNSVAPNGGGDSLFDAPLFDDTFSAPEQPVGRQPAGTLFDSVSNESVRTLKPIQPVPEDRQHVADVRTGTGPSGGDTVSDFGRPSPRSDNPYGSWDGIPPLEGPSRHADPFESTFADDRGLDGRLSTATSESPAAGGSQDNPADRYGIDLADLEDRIFGRDSSVSDGKSAGSEVTSGGHSQRGARSDSGGSEAPSFGGFSDGMFDSVADDLNRRADEALRRARSAAEAEARRRVDSTGDSIEGYLRQKSNDFLPQLSPSAGRSGAPADPFGGTSVRTDSPATSGERSTGSRIVDRAWEALERNYDPFLEP